MIEILDIKKGYDRIKPLLDMGESNIYLYPEYFNLYKKSTFFRIIGLKPEFLFLNYSFKCLVYSKDNKVYCGFPFKFSNKKKEIQFFWDQKSLNNFIYDKDYFSQNVFDEIIDFLFLKYPDFTIKLINIDPNTLLYKFIHSTNIAKISESSSECVSIHIENGYDCWYQSLSKSTKQNLRTAYNRLKTDNSLLVVKHYDGVVPKKIVRKMMYLQRYRSLEKSGRNYGAIHNFLCYIGSFLSLINPRVQMLFCSKACFSTVAWINGELSAFCAGFKSNEGRFFIPFLKYNSAHSRYSPGGIVINECIKELTKDSHHDFDLKEFDLMKGAESYKFTYGGVCYKNFHFIICRGDSYAS